MITAVDTNILLDLAWPDSPHYESSLERYTSAVEAGDLIVSEVVYAELAARFDQAFALTRFLADVNVTFTPSGGAALHRGGVAWSAYTARRRPGLECHACGHAQSPRCNRCNTQLRSRQHVIGDFLIAGHALEHADQLLTRDLGYYRTYFPRLRLA